MNAQAKFETYEKKLQGICDENELIYTLAKNGYPIVLTIKPMARDMEEQMSFLENEDDEKGDYTSVDASLRIYFRESGDEKPVLRFDNNFTIADTLLTKIKTLFVNMHNYWLRHFFETAARNKLVDMEALPDMEDADDLPEDEPEDADPLDELMDDLEDAPEDEAEDADGPAGDGNYPETEPFPTED